uniref:Gnk2-homologous domain-containing protein n=1 Tax=Kalanchoe fedtschenkoi TaxID=63787 RepID=A0A7N0U4P6_KALFE
MGSLKLLIVAALAVSVLVYGVRGQTEIRLYQRCGSSGNYTSNSTYEVNLKTAFSSMTSNDQIDYGFYNVSVGESPDRAYAFALCRGDLSLAACRRCVNYSTVDLPELCPVEREAIVWYDNCMLRYSNSNIFRGQGGGPIYYKWNTRNTAYAGLSQLLESLFTDLKSKASSGDSLRKYAYGEAYNSLFGRIYALVQCTPDLTMRECGNCLDDAFQEISNYFPGREGGRVYRPACNFRYEIYQFYETSSSAPPPPSPPVVAPPPPSPPVVAPPPMFATSPTNDVPTEGGSNNTIRSIIIIVVSTFSFVVLVTCVCVVIRRKRLRKKLGSGDGMKSVESLQFDFHTIRVATNNF